jgi:DNA-binding transcriptional LysR family regulator
VGIVPRMCVQEEGESGKLKVKPIEEFREERTLWAVRKRSDKHLPASQVFMEVTLQKKEMLATRCDGDARRFSKV